MDIDELIESFENVALLELAGYKTWISTKELSGDIYPPYVPRVGEEYQEGGIMLYGMAQSVKMNKSWMNGWSRRDKIQQLVDQKWSDVSIAPYQVMLGAAGMYMLAKNGVALESLDAVHRQVAATNYYKFSLHTGTRDINPESALPGTQQQCAAYRSINDALVKRELSVLKPSVIITFKGRHLDILKQQAPTVQRINDPSWILQGAKGILKPGKSWARELADPQARALAKSYAEQITHKRYRAKAESVAIYLLKYWSDWSLA